MTVMCIVPRNVERHAARSAPVLDIAAATAFGLVPGDEPQGTTSPQTSWRVPDIEAQLTELTSLVTDEL